MSALNGIKNYSKAFLVVICFAASVTIGVIRYLTGPEWALSAFFFIPHYSDHLEGRDRGGNFCIVYECYIMAGSRFDDGECFFERHHTLFE